MSKDPPSLKTVGLKELNKLMFIEAYTGFDNRYTEMDAITCEWLKFNFPGTELVVQRKGKQLTLPFDEIKIGDTLLRIQQFPEWLSSFVHVNRKLIQELEKRGINRFDVRIIRQPKTDPLEARQKAIRKTQQFIEKVKQSLVVGKTAADAVENLMDAGSKERFSFADISSVVNTIVEKSMTDAISAVASLKASDQTYMHCVEVAVIFQLLYKPVVANLGADHVFKDDHETLLAAFLHDIGKARIPKEILDSTERFERESREMMLMQSHPALGAEMLAAKGMPGHTVGMAHHHHIKVDTSHSSSYPKGIAFEDVGTEARLLAIVDVFQALIGRRSYKDNWSPPAAIKFIDRMTDASYDLRIWNEFVKNMGRYPKGSAVELSDGSQGFVVNVPDHDLSRPQIVQVKNHKGEELKNHPLINLQIDKELAIVKDLDAFQAFGLNALDVFTNLQVV